MTSKSVEKSTTPSNTGSFVLDDVTREFVRLALGAGLVQLEELKKTVVSLLSEGESITKERLATGLIGSGLLTDWQAKKLMAGRGRGFFLGSYKLLRPLGKGGMGVVYLGEHKVMKRPMALKILSNESAMDERRMERFKAEAQAAAQLDHSNIVRAYDFSEDDGRSFIAMEYVEGIDLQQAVQRDGVMSIEAALDAMRQAASGLAHAHGRGIVHRDIKPANLLLRSDGVLKISDMGLARMGWQGEAPNAAGKSRLLGTSEFLAPEQALDSRAVDGRADIYSLGCTLYFLLTGKPPFQAATHGQRIAKHQTAAIPDIRSERKDCPPALAQLATRMMAKRPEDRVPSATELLTLLSRIRVGPGQGGERPLRRIAPASDTLSDGSLYQSTLSDSSLGGDVEPMLVVDDRSIFDFGSLPLPSVPMSPNAGVPRFAAAASGTGQRQIGAGRTSGAGPYVAPVAKPEGVASQQIMLGIGLALACLALLAVVGIGIFVAMRPEEVNRPTIKSTEDSNGKPIIIIQ